MSDPRGPHGPGRVTSEPLKPRHKSKMRPELRMLKIVCKWPVGGCPCVGCSTYGHHVIEDPGTTRLNEKSQTERKRGCLGTAAVAVRTLIVRQRFGYTATDDSVRPSPRPDSLAAK